MDLFSDVCAGIHPPLANASRALGIQTFIPIDADPDAGGPGHDLTVPLVFDFVTRLCWSGCAALAAASSPCSACSKMRDCPEGPRALRSYDDLGPKPDFSVPERLELDTSRAIHKSVVILLNTFCTRGGHACWENPPSSVAAEEQFVLDFSNTSQLHSCKWQRAITDKMFSIPGCSLLLTTPHTGMSGLCRHGPHADASLRGRRD